MSREFKIFEVDKHGNRWFVVSRNTMESAKYYLRSVLKDADVSLDCTFEIETDTGERYGRHGDRIV